MILKCLIVDDEPLAHKILTKYIANTPNLTWVGSCYNAKEARLKLEKEPIDIVFLDIQMPEIDGIYFLKSIVMTQQPAIIITTAFRKYALDGFDLGVVDFLLKPIDFERFSKSVERAKSYIAFMKIQQPPNSNADDFDAKDALVIRANGKKIVLNFDEISYLQGLKDYTIIYTPEKKHLIKGYIKLIEDMLPESLFTRVHKSFIVSNSRVKTINKNQIEIDSFKIPIGRSFKKNVMATLV